MNHAARSQKEQRFKERMGHQVEMLAEKAPTPAATNM